MMPDQEVTSRSRKHLPLSGVRVVAIEQAVAAPFATRQLADLGADVIKVERVGEGDFARGYDETVRGLSSYFVWLNRSKRSIQLDLKSTESEKILTRLLDTADVLVSNLGPGAAERLGIGREQIRKEFPRLVNCLVSGFGADGPWGNRKAYDLIVQGEAGLLSITGTGDDGAKVGISIADIATGMYAFAGILTALYHREVTGQATSLNVPVFDSLMEWMGAPLYFTRYGGAPPARSGMAHATIAPYGPYETADGAVILAVQNAREWASFCRLVLEDESLIPDERFVRNSTRVANRVVLDDLITRRTRDMPSDDLVVLLDRAGIAHGGVNSVAQLTDHPLLGPGKRVHVDSEVGSLEAWLPPIRFSEFSAQMSRVPRAGQDTESILGEIGFGPSEVARLREAGVIE